MTHKPRTRTRIDSVRVIVELPNRHAETVHLERYLRQWKECVERRLDDLPYDARVDSEIVSTEVCVLCGLTPESDTNGYPQCCYAAQVEFEAAVKDGGGK